MKIRRIAVIGLALGALAAGLVATPASAIQRDACNSQNVQVVPDATTCWAYAGTKSVTLYNVSQVYGGINAGYVKTSTGAIYEYNRNMIWVWPPHVWNPWPTVTVVNIKP